MHNQACDLKSTQLSACVHRFQTLQSFFGEELKLSGQQRKLLERCSCNHLEARLIPFKAATVCIAAELPAVRYVDQVRCVDFFKFIEFSCRRHFIACLVWIGTKVKPLGLWLLADLNRLRHLDLRLIKANRRPNLGTAYVPFCRNTQESSISGSLRVGLLPCRSETPMWLNEQNYTNVGDTVSSPKLKPDPNETFYRQEE
jgi:hypothetical protein